MLRGCRRIYHATHVPGAREDMSRLCGDLVDLGWHYRAGVDRLRTYSAMAADVLDGAVTGGPVALAVYGHPLVLSVPCSIVRRMGPGMGLRVTVLPAVSALDCLSAELGVDLVAMGLQTHEATDLLLYDRPILPQLATVLWQVGALETRLHSPGLRSRPERFGRLTGHLLRFYPPEHPVVAVCAAVSTRASSEIHRFTLTDLADRGAELHIGMTLYLPPVPAGPPDPDLAARLTSRSHLNAMTEPPET